MLAEHYTIGEMLKRRARFHPDVEALVGGTRRITFQAFHQITNQIAYYLLDLGVRTGDRVALLCSTNYHFSLLYYAAAKVGAITVGLNWRNTPEELSKVLADAAPKVLFYDDLFAAKVDACTALPAKQIQVFAKLDLDPVFWQTCAQYSSDDLAIELHVDLPLVLTYTSGTTGTPKGVVITHRNLYHAAVTNAVMLQKQVGDRMLYMTPLSHITGVGMLGYHAQVGCTYVFMPNFNPQSYMQLLEHERISHAFLVPGLVELLYPAFVRSKSHFSSLKEIVSGGSFISPETIKRYYLLGYNITNIYAATEACFISMWKPHMGLEHNHTVGHAFFADIKITDPHTHEELPPEKPGEITVRSEMLFTGYWNNPQKTQDVLRDGWYYTGDIGKITKDGCIQLIDRYKDLIVLSGGETIYPAQVEKVIKEMSGVAEVAVVGAKHPIWHELPIAYVVKKEVANITERDILEHTYQTLAEYQLRGVAFIDELPKNAYGKVLKTELRKIVHTE